jgi:hypothetical protein
LQTPYLGLRYATRRDVFTFLLLTNTLQTPKTKAKAKTPKGAAEGKQAAATGAWCCSSKQSTLMTCVVGGDKPEQADVKRPEASGAASRKPGTK